MLIQPSIALFEPDIPQNAGAIMRLCACLDLPLHVIEPCGFLLDDRKLRRADMDYLAGVSMSRHVDWQAFEDSTPAHRRILASAHAEVLLPDFDFAPGDIIVMGRESAGAPDYVHQACQHRVRLPLVSGQRSINVAQAASIFAFEACRQLHWFSHLGDETRDDSIE